MGKDAKYVVRLSVEDRVRLQGVLAEPRAARARVLRARIILNADADGLAWSNVALCEAFDVSDSTVYRLRQQFVLEGLDAALNRKPPSATKPRKLDGAAEAMLVATACGKAPEGRARWTIKLLAKRLVELKIVDSIGEETVRQTLKKTNSNLGGRSNGSSRPTPMPSSSATWKTH